MKKILSLLAIMLGALVGYSQAPGILNYQGVARNSVGNVLVNKTINLRLTIRDGAAAGPTVYQESRIVTTNPFGLFNVQVGSPGATSVTGTIPGVSWAFGAKFIQVEIDPNGGTAFINIGTAQLASVPYSLFSTLAGDLVLPFNKTQADPGTLFKITNSNTTSAGATALEGLTNSTAGNANAIIGTVTSGSPGGFSAGVRGINNGTGGLGIGVYGSQAGSGWGVYGFTPGGIGVNGASNTGIGVNGTSNTGTGGRFTTTSGLSLHTTGALRHEGVGEALNRILRSDAAGNATWVDPSAVGIVTGTGTLNFVSKWTPSGTNLGNSLLFDNGTSMGIGTTTPTHRFDVTHTGSTGIGINSTAGFSVLDINAASGDAALRLGAAGVNQWNIRNQPGVNNLQFFELGGGGERMAIYDGTGNIAIGGSTGSYRLDILHGGSTGILNKSSASFSVIDIDAASGDAAIRFINNGVNQWNIRNQPGTDNLQFFELGGGGERMAIYDGTGNVAIGAADGSYRLDVQHGGSTGIRSRSSGSFSVVDIDAASGDAALRFAKAGVNQWNIRNRPADDYLEIFELGGGGSRFVIQDGTGNVGIGQTVSPIYKLDVLHAGSTGLRVQSSASFSVIDIDANSGDAALRFVKAGANQWNIRNRPADDYLEIFELGGGGSRVVIQDGTGNVGIGETTSPSYKLDVLHSGSTGARIRSDASFSVVDIDAASGDAALRFVKAGANQWNIRNNPGTDDLQIFELGGGGERMRIENTTGRVVVDGDLHVAGTLSKTAGAFKIDHPMDPENKYLVHSFVESPDMMNIYNGNITTDASGKATVQLPDYFNTLNKDFRYQLTVIGSFAQAIVSKEVNNNSFEIATNQPNVKVSWQVTGVRQDPWANKFRIPNVVDKAPAEKGKYLNPEAYNLPEARKIGYTPEPVESSLNYTPNVSNKPAPANTGGSLDYVPKATVIAKPVDVKGTSVEDVPAAKTANKPAPGIKGSSVEDVKKPGEDKKPAEEKKTENSSVSEKSKTE
jgi:hypothetical protein